MTLLENVQRGRRPMPPRCLIYGQEGIGKSSVAAGAARPIFIDIEDGLGEIDCERLPSGGSLAGVLAALAELAAASHHYETVVIDSLDWLERLIFDVVCHEHNVASIEKADGGYGKGYVHALSHWRRVVDALTVLRNAKGMMVILIAHSKVERFEDPESAAYDRYTPRIHKHACALITEWCDAVLFATRKFRVEKADRGFGKERTIAKEIGKDGGERILRTSGSPACVAKNRYSMPTEIELSWPALFAGLTKESTS